jgi:hypothetical protein
VIISVVIIPVVIISRGILLRMINVLDKRSRENQNTHFILNCFLLKIVPFKRKCGEQW